tara:strand:- start:1060 stop:1488 length:429 start_codon:yes stop_codon:yes gene_type:complete
MPKYKITFTNEINTSVQNGDNLYLRIFAADAVKDDNNIEVTSAVDAQENILVGKIENLSSKTIDVEADSDFNTTIPDLTAELESTDSKPLNYSDVSFFSFHKNNNLNVSNVKGYFAKVKMSVTSSSKKELFSIGSEVSVSSK